MSKLLYNGVELPPVPAHDADATVEVISAVLPAALSMYAQSPYILVIGKGTLWQGGKCYVRGVSAVYRLSGDAWMWHYGSGTVSAQDIVAANYFEAIWTNTDIPTADGAGIYLAASAPVDPNAPDEPEPEEPPVEPNVDVAAIYRRGWMDGFLSGINIRGILHRRTVEEPQPVTAYLYGTPSPTIVTYNGVELPELPEWDKVTYPYAYLNEDVSGAIEFICATKAFEHGTYLSGSTSLTNTHISVSVGTIEKRRKYTLSGNEWGSPADRTYDRTSSTTGYMGYFDNVFWCNTDIPNIDTNTVYLAASEPVYSQVGGNVALADGDGFVLYNGAIQSAEEAEQFPFVYIRYATAAGGYYSIAAFSKEVYFNTNDNKIYWRTDGGSIKYRYAVLKADFVWGNTSETEWYSILTSQTGIMWANFDMKDQTGATYISKSDPIPLVSAEPVAAVYGGTKLPVLSEWDEAYSHATILLSKIISDGVWNTVAAYLVASTTNLTFSANLGGRYLWGVAAGASKIYMINLQKGETAWTLQEERTFGVGEWAWDAYTGDAPIWANFDVMYHNEENVACAASDFIAIYEIKE